ncbi:hypothetical protein [Weissella viridescens]|jgi:hypothetical protein|uniref:hypothetical protein n=1 Tax=Weissella viridescens TaxID=1629 RepID=UPI0017476390|nr:hypothetical protein [Weissella viridescens]MBX4172092.1 hypothetical protein [Weissella viridescens]MCB6839711.1 hypothetical protein [Weissella viridescens]MCB6846443.1 hypothetical protein [Weissella viridescens]QOD85723.1 hypothetical protein IE337_05840 [Weissella viridescens]WJI90837.1 hypothetical protein PWA48_05830 [Weissella viridescens]
MTEIPKHNPLLLAELLETAINPDSDKLVLATLRNCTVIDNADLTDEQKIRAFKTVLSMLIQIY